MEEIFNTENLEIMLSVVGLILTSVICIIKAIINGKQKRWLKDSTTLLDAVAPLMEIAEKYVNYSGEEKKQYVLTKINQLAIENGVHFNAEQISTKIEELIVLSKKVNNKNKEMEKDI